MNRAIGEMMKNNGTSEKNYLSKQNTDALKGIFSICILFAHLYSHSGINQIVSLNVIFNAMGYLSVAMFFFLSAYGLSISYSKNEHDYLRFFPITKIIPFYCLIVFLTILYSIENIIIGEEFNFKLLIKSLLFGETVIKFGWYLQVQILFYILFYLIFTFVKNNMKAHLHFAWDFCGIIIRLI